MDFYPKQADAEAPSVASGLTLAAAQLICGLLMVFIAAIFHEESGAGLSAVGAMVGAMSYASFTEMKTPGALSRRPLVLRLALIASIVQVLLALGYFALFFALSYPPSQSDPADLTKTISMGLLAVLVCAAGVVFFLITWLGLWQGRRMVEKQRQRIRTPQKI